MTQTTSDHQIAQEQLQRAWAKHQIESGAGYQAQSFEAGWNAAIETGARSYLIGEKLLQLQGKLP